MREESSKLGTWRLEISRRQFDAAIVDLDGVLTQTGGLHALCWKRALDTFMREYAPERNEGSGSFVSFFEGYLDYLGPYPRSTGVQRLLASRGIELPRGTLDDPPGSPTLCGIRNHKDELFLDFLERHGIEIRDSARCFVKALRRASFKTAVVSSSGHCLAVLAAADALELFDAKIDGDDCRVAALAGRPAPDILLAAALKLGVSIARSVVIDDQIAGMVAGRAGEFGEVIGIAHGARVARLLEHGADHVVGDLGEIRVGSSTRANRDEIRTVS